MESFLKGGQSFLGLFMKVIRHAEITVDLGYIWQQAGKGGEFTDGGGEVARPLSLLRGLSVLSNSVRVVLPDRG